LKTAFHKAWNNLGIAYLETNRFEEAVQCFEKAVDLNPEYSFAQASLAATYIHRNKPKQAIEHLRKAVSLNATLSEAHGNLALAYAMIGKYRGAEQALQQATALGYENWQDVRKRITALQQMDSPQIAMDRPDIQDIIAALAGEPIEEREAAAKSLRDLAKREMSTEEGLLALRAATHEFPPRRYNFLDSSADLIRAAAEQPQFGAAAR
jgi:tetratricopeptide (TPR) repeat protein